MRLGFFLKKISTLKIDIRQIAFINGKGRTGFWPVVIDCAAGVFLGSSQKGTSKEEFATLPALIAFARSQLFLLFYIILCRGTEDHTPNFIGQLFEKAGRIKLL